LTPEFRNRLDATVTFGSLGTKEIERVVDKQIDDVRGMVVAALNGYIEAVKDGRAPAPT
jgi:ATP-dependent Clp protease ATP-binding subunit ClpA